MSNIEIRLARREDEVDVRNFIDAHWKKGHILATSAELFRWQHASREDDSKINFVLATDPRNREIQAILGYIPLKHFDPSLRRTDIFLAMWKVRADVKLPGLGLSLLTSLQKSTSADLIAVIGLSQMVVGIYRAIGYEVGQLRHHVLFSPTVECFRIASGVTTAMRPSKARPSGRLITQSAGTLPELVLQADIDRICEQRLPRKSWTYLCARYSNHPAYAYQFSFFVEESQTKCMFVWRKIAVNGSAALRIVDLLGDESVLERCTGDLHELLDAHQAEYLDIDHWGVAPESLARAGFIDRRQEPSLVVPGHFEPFESRNIDVGFCYKIFNNSNEGGVRLLRGDSDQDRPNQR